MVITRKYNNTKPFEDLYNGDVFMYAGNAYMVVNNPNDQNNAVNLHDGDLCHFTETQTVYIIDYDFTIMV